MLHVVLGVADEAHELPRRLLVRAVLIDQVRPRKQGPCAGAGLLARQCVDLEVHVGRILLQPAEEPRLAEDDRRALLAERVFGIAERETRHLVLQHEIAEKRQRSHHLRAVREAGGLVEPGAQHPRAPCVRERQELVGDSDRMALAADGKADLRRIAALRIRDGQLLHRGQPVGERLRRIVRIEAGFLEHVDVDVHLLEVAVLDRDAVAHALPLADLCHVLREVLLVDLLEISRHPVAEVVLPAPVVRHAHEDVGRAALRHEGRQVLRLVALVGDRDDFDLVSRFLANSFPLAAYHLLNSGF